MRQKIISYFVGIYLLCSLVACNKMNTPHTLQSLVSPNAKVRISYDNKDITVHCRVAVIKDSLISLSFYPIVGAEAYRVEMTKRDIIVYDRLQHQFAQTRLSKINMLLTPNIKYKLLQQWLLSYQEDVIHTFTVFGKKLSVQFIACHLKNNENRIKSIDKSKYEKVNLTKMFYL